MADRDLGSLVRYSICTLHSSVFYVSVCQIKEKVLKKSTDILEEINDWSQTIPSFKSMQNWKWINPLLPAQYVSVPFQLNSHNSEIISIMIIFTLWKRKLTLRHEGAKPLALSTISDRPRVPTPGSAPPSSTAVCLHPRPVRKQISVLVCMAPKWLCGSKNACEPYRIGWRFRRKAGGETFLF